ncbi:unnamed protein product [Litomosoides sigmodontis]|uniref:Uncharacterized protein n=1 Tax=Litomosoides sigmodontis TaxID=42156 RepID=A0A3P6VCQ5_LITSI|nr:unnamed protein product [Litomosoides sigmodontis]
MLPRNLQTLRDKKSNWSLAEDQQLCSTLEEIRSSLTLRINNISDAIQENSLKIANACVQVSNLNNRLSSFTADQFIESRVVDDGSICVNPTSISQKVVPNKQAEKTNNLRQAVSMGLELMRTHFKRIDVRPEDLDEDDDSLFMPEPIFEPYDENLSRPLPLLIGSPDWNSSSYAGSSEECAEITKVTEDVVINLPPFAQPRIVECGGSSYPSEFRDGKLGFVISKQATLDIKGAEAKIDGCLNEYSGEIYLPEKVVATSDSQGSFATSDSQGCLLKEKEIGNIANFVPDLIGNGVSRQYSEVPVISRNLEESLTGSKVSYRPPDMKVSSRVPESQIPVKRLTADAMEDQEKEKISEGVSNAVGELFVDNSSDDDLFSDLKNTIVKTKQHIPAYSSDSQTISITERGHTNLQTDMDVRSPDFDVSEPNSLKVTDCIFVKDATSNTFRNKLDSILSNRIMPNAISDLEKKREKEIEGERIMNDRTNTVLPSLAKLRSKGPPRRSPSRLLQNSGKHIDTDDLTSDHPSALTTTSAGDNQTIQTKICKERQDGQLKVDLWKHVTENVNNLKQGNSISSIFSSDSDDDIFSTFSIKSKTNIPASKSCIGNNSVQSLPNPRNHSVSTPTSRAETSKTDCKFKNLFDSDDDLFVNSIPIKKQGQESARDRVILARVTQEAIIPKKDELTLEKKETVLKKKLSTSKPKKVDIFDDDSDGDLFS